MARPQSAGYQLQKFARRHRPAVIGVVAVFAVLIAGVIASTLLATRTRHALLAAVVERNRALEAESKAGMARDRAAAAEETARAQRDVAIRAELQATSERSRAIEAEAQARQDRDRLLWQSLSRQSVRDSESRVDDNRAALLARQATLFHDRTPDQPQHLVEEALQQAVRLDPVSRRMLPGYETDVYSVAFSPDGRTLASSEHNAIRLWDLRNLATPAVLLEAHDRAVYSVAFSPDSTRLASASFIGGSYAFVFGICAVPAFACSGSRLSAVPSILWRFRRWRTPGFRLRRQSCAGMGPTQAQRRPGAVRRSSRFCQVRCVFP